MRRLTGREIQVIELLSKGWGNKQIAFDLGISIRTVKEYVRSLMWKLQIENRRRITLVKYWACPLFRLGAGYEIPLTSAADVIEHDRVRGEKDARPHVAD